MAISFWRGKRPKTTHEADAQTRVVADLKRLYFAGDDPVVIAFDVWFTGADIDMLVLKHDALIIVELKHCASKIRGGVNGDWEIVGSVPRATLKGGTFDNPFLQIQHYYYRLREYLEENKMRFLKAQPASQIHFAVERGANHRAATIDAILAFDPTTHPDSEIDVKKRWLRLSGLNDLAERIYDTHSGHAFSEEDLSRLVEVMGCKQDMRYSAAAIAGGPAVRPLAGSEPLSAAEVRTELTSAELWAFLSGKSLVVDDPSRNELQLIRLKREGPLAGLRAHGTGVRAVAVSADGRRALSAAGIKVQIWDLESCTQPRSLYSTYTSSVYDVALTADGRRAVSGYGDGTLMVWDVESGKKILTLEGYSKSVKVSISRDGRRAVVATEDGTLKVWNLETGTELYTLADSVLVWRVAISSDATRAVSISINGSMKVWSLEDGKNISTISGHLDGVYGVALGDGGRWAVDDKLRIWNLEAGAMLRTLTPRPGKISGVELSADGRWLLAGSDNVEVWDLTTAKISATFNCGAPVRCCAIADNGTIVAGDAKGHVHFLQLDIGPQK